MIIALAVKSVKSKFDVVVYYKINWLVVKQPPTSFSQNYHVCLLLKMFSISKINKFAIPCDQFKVEFYAIIILC